MSYNTRSSNVEKVQENQGGANVDVEIRESREDQFIRLLQEQNRIMHDQMANLMKLTEKILSEKAEKDDLISVQTDNRANNNNNNSGAREAMKMMQLSKNIDLPELKGLSINQVRSFIEDLEKYRRLYPEADDVKVQNVMVSPKLLDLIALNCNEDIIKVQACPEAEFLELVRQCIPIEGITRLSKDLKSINMKNTNLSGLAEYDKAFSFVLECAPLEFRTSKLVIQAFCDGIRPRSIGEETANRRFNDINLAKNFVVQELKDHQRAIERGWVSEPKQVKANVAQNNSKKVEKKKNNNNSTALMEKKCEDECECTITVKCYECGENHKLPQCQIYLEKRKKDPKYHPLKNKKESQKPKKNKVAKAKAATVVNLDDDEDDMIVSACGIIENGLVADTSVSVDAMIYLDSGASAHFIKNEELLSDIKTIDQVRLSGVNSMTTINQIGYLDQYGEAYLLPNGLTNLISMSRLVEDGYEVTLEDNIFTVKKDLFKQNFTLQSNGLYGSRVETAMFAKNISDRQKKRALDVLKFQEVLGFPSDEQLGEALKHGCYQNCDFTISDLKIARELHGPSAIIAQGKMTAPVASSNNGPEEDIVGKRLYADLMFLRGASGWIFLVTCDDATGFIAMVELKDQTEPEIFSAFKKIIGYYKSYGHTVNEIITDSGANLVASEDKMLKSGIRMVYRTPEKHANKAERAIRVIKERARCILASLKYKLPGFLYGDLVKEAAKCINLVPNIHTKTRTPREIVTGRKPHFGIDLQTKFGDGALFRKPKTAKTTDLEPRSEYGIVIGRELDNRGALRVYIVGTNQIVRRIKHIKIDLPDNIIEQLNFDGGTKFKSLLEDESIDKELEMLPIPEKVDEVANYGILEHCNISVNEALNGKDKVAIKEAIMKECRNLLDLNCFTPTNEKKRSIYSSMIINDKYDAQGNFIKVKARLVAGGNTQSEDSYHDTSAPTVDQASLFMGLGIAKFKMMRISTGDVPCAYLNANLDDDIYMNIQKNIVPFCVELKPEWKEFVRNDGTMIVKLNKALYGLKQSGLQWYKRISKFLIDQGYNRSIEDKCVFYLHSGNKTTIIMIHVDDIMIFTNSNREDTRIKSELSKEFGIEKFDVNEFNYLGMHINNINSHIEIDQIAYVKKLLTRVDDIKIAKTPSTSELFTSRDEEPSKDPDKFRSLVMALMFVAKRSRPDILKEVCYLATRIQCTTIEDDKKLLRIFGYLKGTVDMKLIINPKTLEIILGIDASNNIYLDAKGHTGMNMSFGLMGAMIMVRSIKQKLVARSSTESELIALDDCICYGLWARRLAIELGCPTFKLKVLQDNKSAILIGNNGFNSDNTNRHMRNRFYFIKQCIDNGDIELIYTPTEDMLADFFTKPLTGSRFYRLRDEIMGIKTQT